MIKSFKLRKLNNKGTTMMVCVVLIAILIIFTFALTLAAYTLYASQNKNVASMKCAEAANTLSIALDKELMDENAAQNSHLYQYIRYNICQSDEKYWPYYDPKATEEGHGKDYAYRYFDLKYNKNKAPSGMDGFPGNIKLCIYWKLPLNADKTGTKSFDSIKNVTGENSNKTGVRLYIEITCEAASQSYTVTNVYELSESDYASDDYNKKYLEMINDSENTLRESVNPMLFDVDVSPKTHYNWDKNWSWKKVYDDIQEY